MTKPRDGHHTATVQFPLDLWAVLCAEAEGAGMSVNRLIAAELAKSRGLTLPPVKSPGPKPRRPEPEADETPPKRRRKP